SRTWHSPGTRNCAWSYGTSGTRSATARWAAAEDEPRLRARQPLRRLRRRLGTAGIGLLGWTRGNRRMLPGTRRLGPRYDVGITKHGAHLASSQTTEAENRNRAGAWLRRGPVSDKPSRSEGSPKG